VHPAAMLIGDSAAPKDRFRREIGDEQGMPARRPNQCFRDIVENIDLIIRFAAAMSFNIWETHALDCLSSGACRSLPKPRANWGPKQKAGARRSPGSTSVRLIPGCGEYPIITHRVVSNIITDGLAASRWHVSGS
jgi:hypothetical protein